MIEKRIYCVRSDRRKRCWGGLAVALLFLLQAGAAQAVSTFASGVQEKRIPAPFSLDEIWFYGRDGKKVIPDISLEWVAVIFRAEEGRSADGGAPGPLDLRALEEKARRILVRHSGFEDFFCDTNLAEEGCFLKVEGGVEEGQLLQRILELDRDVEVDYAHPALDLGGRTFAFFNAIDLKWKTGVELEGMEQLLGQARVWPDGEEQICRVDLFQIPLFRAVNLLAEDIHVAGAVPYLVEIKPSLRATVVLGLHGANMGDKIPFSYTVTFLENIQIDPSSLANISLRPENIQKELFEMQVDPYDYVKAVRSSPIRISGWIKFFAPGEYAIPPLKMKYTCTTCSDNRERSLETERLSFRVASIVPRDQTQNRLIVPGDLLDPEDKEADYRLGANQKLLETALFLVLAFLLGGWLLLGMYHAKRDREAEAETRREDLLAGRLQALLAERPKTAHWMFVEEAGSLFRRYLTERFAEGKDPSGGSGQIYFDSIRERLPEGMAAGVHELLKEIDSVIALEKDPYPGLERFIEEMMELVHRPAPER